MNKQLDIHRLAGGYKGISPAIGAHLVEACAVTLVRSTHSPGVELSLRGMSTELYNVHWNEPLNADAETSWADQQYATEHAAVCLGILFADEVVGFERIERSVKGTGFDYWMGEHDGFIFNKKARLEISGIFNGGTKLILKRVAQKKAQTAVSAGTGLPAYISVTEFGAPCSNFEVL